MAPNLALRKLVQFENVVLDVLNMESSAMSGAKDQVAHIAHLGGALYGFLVFYALRNGKDYTRWFDKWMDAVAGLFKPRPRSKMKVKYSKRRSSSGKANSRQKFSDEDFNKAKKERQERIDAILDKISRSGYESLSKEEKEILFKASKE